VDRCISENCLYIPYLIWVIYNMIPVAIGSLLVAYVEVKCVLGLVYLYLIYVDDGLLGCDAL
jgi:hypothetical protein